MAQEYFEKTFQENKPEYEIEIENKKNLLETISQVTKSKSQAKRFILQNAVDVNEKTQNNPQLNTVTGDKIKIGQKIFVKVS
ncbi:hypothetical protein A2159_01795 [Candidatus Woesebacteria bacterium RBG_13_34_9]|uniref:RNA-binding S4 domain-containing protein n=1 Tax=Candidatus Woesebacteria bacterium RBG_13_34_9 TaxID=1802477 RepID=A0A1F7X230_9BACT|nr:MAG: hypothetical protein A2159_01795 [Candidatus Woesebacteria bacterium RBG_13_34_9]